MKFTYDGADLSKTIKSYIIKKDKIIVTYLDNKKEIFELSKETKIIDEMVNQAIERDNQIDINSLREESKRYGFYSSLQGLALLLSYTPLLKSITLDNSTLKSIIFAFNLANILFYRSLVNKKVSRDKKIMELTKYKIFLSLKEEIESCKDKRELLINLKTNKDIFNINNLDSIKFSDLEQLVFNLINVKEKSLIKK